MTKQFLAISVSVLMLGAAPAVAQNNGTTLGGGEASQKTGGANKTNSGAEKAGGSTSSNAGADKSAGSASGNGTTLAGGKNGKDSK